MRKNFKNRLREILGFPSLEEQLRGVQSQKIQKAIHSLKTKELRFYFQELVEKSKPGAVFSCQINGIDLLAPVELLRLYPHCLYLDEEKQPIYWIEPQQSDWLCEKVQPGDTVFDIGAAFGVISFALSKKVGKKGKVYSFDPSQTAQKVLQKVIDLNELSNIEIVHKAISDRAGSESFIEYTADNELSWASDASSLYAETINPELNHLEYTVEVTTIDDYVTQQGLEPKAIKIDIEGFELYGLHGGKKTLEKFSPYLCIDIHRDVKTGESALLGVEPFLRELGYDLRMEDHAVYCTPEKLVNSAGE